MEVWGHLHQPHGHGMQGPFCPAQQGWGRILRCHHRTSLLMSPIPSGGILYRNEYHCHGQGHHQEQPMVTWEI